MPMFQLNICNGIVAAKETLACNVFELRKEKLNLQRMDEEEVQKLNK